jgi:phage baseplate assembly protein W
MQTIDSIYYPFAIDQGLGTFKEETDYAQHVQQMMMQILFTNPGERINRPDFGCGLRRMVFAPNNTGAASLLQVMIYQSMQKWLANVISVNSVQVTACNETLQVSIQYALLVQPGKLYLNVEVTL